METFLEKVRNLLALLTFPDVELKVEENDADVTVVLTLPADASGVLIGYHGEKIDALQLILSLMFNQGKTMFKPVRLDINDYRERRTQSLHELADKAASQALISGREIILPPLSPGERRIVHIYLGEREDVQTYSEGLGLNRRLIIRPAADKSPTPQV